VGDNISLKITHSGSSKQQTLKILSRFVELTRYTYSNGKTPDLETAMGGFRELICHLYRCSRWDDDEVYFVYGFD